MATINDNLVTKLNQKSNTSNFLTIALKYGLGDNVRDYNGLLNSCVNGLEVWGVARDGRVLLYTECLGWSLLAQDVWLDNMCAQVDRLDGMDRLEYIKQIPVLRDYYLHNFCQENLIHA